jgi:hypothetical protein
MRTIKIGVCIVAVTAALGVASFTAGKAAADRYYDSMPEITNCPDGAVCRWSETNLTTGQCLKNCDTEPAATWNGETGRWSCREGFQAIISEEEVRDNPDGFKPSCVR